MRQRPTVDSICPSELANGSERQDPFSVAGRRESSNTLLQRQYRKEVVTVDLFKNLSLAVSPAETMKISGGTRPPQNVPVLRGKHAGKRMAYHGVTHLGKRRTHEGIEGGWSEGCLVGQARTKTIRPFLAREGGGKERCSVEKSLRKKAIRKKEGGKW